MYSSGGSGSVHTIRVIPWGLFGDESSVTIWVDCSSWCWETGDHSSGQDTNTLPMMRPDTTKDRTRAKSWDISRVLVLRAMFGQEAATDRTAGQLVGYEAPVFPHLLPGFVRGTGSGL
jgi:hypothetical protein